MINRRRMMAGTIAASTLTGRGNAQTASSRTMRHIVMIHGAWHGGWCWSRLAPLLTGVGLETSRVTLTGCGGRRHLLSRAVTLRTHIQDVVQYIEAEELSRVTLLAHSYGGFVATGVADALGDRIDQVIMLDAFVPNDGETVLDYAGAQRKADTIAAAKTNPDFNLAPVPAAALGITDPNDIAWVNRRMTPHPVGTYLEQIQLTRGLESITSKVYVSCDRKPLPVFDSTKQRLRNDPSWQFKSLDTGHDAMITAPQLVAEVVIASAR